MASNLICNFVIQTRQLENICFQKRLDSITWLMPLESGHFCQNSKDHHICVSIYISKYFRRNISYQIGLRMKLRMIRDDFFLFLLDGILKKFKRKIGKELFEGYADPWLQVMWIGFMKEKGYYFKYFSIVYTNWQNACFILSKNNLYLYSYPPSEINWSFNPLINFLNEKQNYFSHRNF